MEKMEQAHLQNVYLSFDTLHQTETLRIGNNNCELHFGDITSAIIAMDETKIIKTKEKIDKWYKIIDFISKYWPLRLICRLNIYIYQSFACIFKSLSKDFKGLDCTLIRFFPISKMIGIYSEKMISLTDFRLYASRPKNYKRIKDYFIFMFTYFLYSFHSPKPQKTLHSMESISNYLLSDFIVSIIPRCSPFEDHSTYISIYNGMKMLLKSTEENLDDILELKIELASILFFDSKNKVKVTVNKKLTEKHSWISKCMMDCSVRPEIQSLYEVVSLELAAMSNSNYCLFKADYINRWSNVFAQKDTVFETLDVERTYNSNRTKYTNYFTQSRKIEKVMYLTEKGFITTFECEEVLNEAIDNYTKWHNNAKRVKDKYDNGDTVFPFEIKLLNKPSPDTCMNKMQDILAFYDDIIREAKAKEPDTFEHYKKKAEKYKTIRKGGKHPRVIIRNGKLYVVV